jgi:hypothetical protein
VQREEIFIINVCQYFGEADDGGRMIDKLSQSRFKMSQSNIWQRTGDCESTALCSMLLSA